MAELPRAVYADIERLSSEGNALADALLLLCRGR